MIIFIKLTLLSILFVAEGCLINKDFYYGTFPKNFVFGSTSSAYQIEGAWNEDGKGESIWDRYVHQNPQLISDGSNGDVAADSYHRFKEDVKMLKNLGAQFYRFSISWPRILPKGDITVINKKGIEYYNNLINELLANGIQPMVTLYDWDLPQPIQDLGGWTNEIIAEYFEDYARIAYTNFGDRVKWWITMSEPWVCSVSGYEDGEFAPGLKMPGVASYLSGHNLLKAHALAYRVYDKEFRPSQKGKCGITLDSYWMEPKTASADHVRAAEQAFQFQLEWFTNPIFSKDGDYPTIMKKIIQENSRKEGLRRSRLPSFNAHWKKLIKGSSDFFGLNHFSTYLVEFGKDGQNPSWYRDSGVLLTSDESWPRTTGPWLRIVPWGLRRLLNWIKNKYNNPLVFITENGMGDTGGLNDTLRIQYLTGYVNELLKAVNLDGCNVAGYLAWSLMDNFAWNDGYTRKFGLYSVDFNDPNRKRTPKESVGVYRNIIKNRGFPGPPKCVGDGK